MEQSESRKDFDRQLQTAKLTRATQKNLRSVDDEEVELSTLLDELDELLESHGGILTP